MVSSITLKIEPRVGFLNEVLNRLLSAYKKFLMLTF